MLNKNNVIQKNELQIKVYKELVIVAKEVKILLSQKEGKQANKRINDFLNDNLKSKYADIGIYINKNKYNDEIECELYHRNRSFNSPDQYTVYIDNNTLNFKIAEGDKKIKIDMINNNLKNRIESIEKQIEKLEYTNKNINEIKKEYEWIRTLINDYKNKYDYSTLNDLYTIKF